MRNNNLFQNKYRISSTRLSGYDYTQPGSYFITMCTKNRIPFFGFIKKDIMCLSEAGSICWQTIEKTKNIRPTTLIDTFIVMPDHVHMIIDIIDLGERDACNASRQKQNFGPQSGNIAAIVRGIKGSVTSQLKLLILNSGFAWQSLYHDHIIRDEAEKQRIIQYIQNNPMNRKYK